MQDKLEKEFLKEKSKVQKQIKKILEEGEKALKKAIEISENTGILFEMDYGPQSGVYIPKSFKTKFEKLYKNIAEIYEKNENDDETEPLELDHLFGDYVNFDDLEYGGWATSTNSC